MSDINRCPKCHWPIVERTEDGCTDGYCSYRPAKAPTRVDPSHMPTIIDEMEATIAALTAKRDAANARSYLEAAHHAHLRKERDEARALAAERYQECEDLHAALGEPNQPYTGAVQRLREERDHYCSIAEAGVHVTSATIEARVVEEIARWLDRRCLAADRAGTTADDCLHNVRRDIREGAWKARP